jgi:hypothetical protein
MMQGNMVVEAIIDSHVPVAATSIVGSSMVEVDEEIKLVFQEPIVNHEEE